MIKDKSIFIKNIYYMLSYAFTTLNQGGYEDVATEEFENTHNLFAAILAKGISRQLEEAIGNRENITASKGDRAFIQVSEEGDLEYVNEVISPIICEGDVIGAAILLNNDPKGKMGEVEQKLVLSAAGFLGRQMEQ